MRNVRPRPKFNYWRDLFYPLRARLVERTPEGARLSHRRQYAPPRDRPRRIRADLPVRSRDPRPTPLSASRDRDERRFETDAHRRARPVPRRARRSRRSRRGRVPARRGGRTTPRARLDRRRRGLRAHHGGVRSGRHHGGRRRSHRRVLRRLERPIRRPGGLFTRLLHRPIARVLRAAHRREVRGHGRALPPHLRGGHQDLQAQARRRENRRRGG